MAERKSLMDLDIGDTRLLIAECGEHGLLRNQCAYVLATVWYESAFTMQPIKETVMPWHNNKFPSDAEVIRRLDNAMARGRLPQVRNPYWRQGDFGRGHVQLTHDYNYAKAEEKTGIPFVSNHGLMLQSDKSALVTVRGMNEGWFTGRKLSDYITLQRSDFVNARRIVNGMDRAAKFAAKAREYDAALRSEGYGVEDTPPAPEHTPEAIAEDAAAENRTSTTEITSVLVGVGGTATAVKEVVEAVDEGTGALLSAGPWVLVALLIIGGGVYIWRERRRKKKQARAALEATSATNA
jgi:predicted chitinase